MTLPSSSPDAESALRKELGIPPDAARVLLFAESSHWDPNWLRTSQEYFQQLVAGNLEQAVQELRRDPRRVYSIECMFFLRLFWESRTDLQDELRDWLNHGRLRLTGSGVTTPDTLLPSEEAILRDLLVGQEWLRSQGITQEPRLAYFPDCFGHSPNLPAILNAAGFDRTAISRIDGMWFLSADLDLPSSFPLHGSSAERLLKVERCLDFTWRAADGSQVLCHWNAFTYGQGDMLAYSGPTRTYLYPWLSRPNRSEAHVARRVGDFVRQLAPLARTPYLFCPIGLDFNPPIPDLVELLERYNRQTFPTSGVWLVNAGLDDYFDLIESYQPRLPVLELDPNPYWTGFYTSRPALKQRAFRLVERLSLCEQLGVLSGDPQQVLQPLEQAWWSAAVANHHDFITGTSPDRVAYGEQIPLLDEALSQAGEVLERLMHQVGHPSLNPAVPATALPEYTQEGSHLHIISARFDLKLAASAGGFLERLGLPGAGEPLLVGAVHEVVQYNESGGLWRMGYEYRGGSFRQVPLNLPPTRFAVQEQDGYLCIQWETALPGESLEHTLWVGRDDPRLYFELKGRAPQKSTLALHYALPFQPRELHMEAPGGLVRRPLTRVYPRTFWPVQRFLHIPNPAGGLGMAILLRHPSAIAVGEDGEVEVVALRNAIRERAYGLFTLPGMPATGIERERTAFRCALAFPRPGEEAVLPGLARGLMAAPWATDEERLSAQVVGRLVQVDADQVFVTALKPAWRGIGFILRLSAPNAPLTDVKVRWVGLHPQRAWLCDARERDIRPLQLNGQELKVPVESAIVTVRVE
jgi:hypothetical protein